MLRITMNKSAAGAKKYYSEDDYYSIGKENSHADYYSEKEQAIGKWGGLGAEKLGLQSNIAKKDFGNLCDNINPATGKNLTSRTDIERRVGYDFTFNASKSVTLAHAFANENDKKEILNAFHGAVKDTMTEIETGMQARVRDKGKWENRETGNIAYGQFTHFTTRPIDGVPDPHLHSHCFVFNATYDDKDKKWKAGEFGQIKKDAPYYEAVIHSKLANNLENLGYRVERTKNGFELAGVDKNVMDKFSRRTKEIEDYSKEHNITDIDQKAQVGAKTRKDKRVELTPEQTQTEWKNRIGEDELAKINNLKERSADFTPKPKEDNAAKEAVQYSLDHHLERKSVASEKEILTTAIKSSIGTATPEQVKTELTNDSNVLRPTKNLQKLITTKDALKEEKLLLVNCNEMKNKFRPINEGYEVKNDVLNDEQKAAVKHALSSTDGIIIISGKAGVGKTTLMTEVKKGIIESGKEIHSFAPSSDASRIVQRSEGFRNADTVAKLIHDKDLQNKLSGQVIWVDEGGQLSNKDMNKIIAIAKEQKAKIILSGDINQHNSVARGDALRNAMQLGGIKSVTVSKIQRQKDEEYKQAVKYLSEGGVEKGFKKLEKMGAINEISDSRGRVGAIAEDYYNSAYTKKKQPASKVPVNDVLVVSPTHAEGEFVTQHIRQKLKDNEVISNDDKEFKVLKNLQYTEAEKQKTENYKQGSYIVFHQNIEGIRAGTRLEVMGREGKNLLARDAKGNPYDVPVEKAQNFTVYEPGKIEVAKGDKIRITRNGYANDGKHLYNGTNFYIHGFDKEGNIKLSNGSTINKDFGHFSLGYVATSHSSQGKTSDKVIISQSSATFRASSIEQFYVSVSRGKQAVAIYTDDKEHLKQAVSQTVQRVSATELLSKNERIKSSAIEQNRLTSIKKMRERAVEAYDKFKDKIKTYGFQRENRTEPGKTR